jgi:hypothetical protein
MRIGFAIMLVLACSAQRNGTEAAPKKTPGPGGEEAPKKDPSPVAEKVRVMETGEAPKKDVAASRAANTRGLALARAKKYREASAEYRKAIAADPSYVLAHYNLACSEALGGDPTEALGQLAWVGNAAAWDDTAKTAIMKAQKDPDLSKLLASDVNAMQWAVPRIVLETIDVSAGVQPKFVGHLLTDADKAQLAKPLTTAPGKHDDQCDPKDAKQGRVYGLALVEGPTEKDTLVASLGDGVALLDPGGALVARSEPIGCTAPNASQDMITGLAYLDGASMEAPTGARLSGMPLYVVQYSNGGRASWTTNVAIFAQRAKGLVRVFEATLSSNDNASAGSLVQTILGDLVFTAPGSKKKLVFRWDASASKFAPLP